MASQMHRALAKYMRLPQGKKIMAEYIWIGGSGQDLRSKTQTLAGPPKSVSDLPHWNYDGSSTGQAEGHNSEVVMVPRKMIIDPFRGGDNLLVMCDTYKADTMEPLESNRRAIAETIFNDPRTLEEEPWFGLEQEYVFIDGSTKKPLGWPEQGYPAPQGPYYCSVGANKNFGRDIVEAHYRACLYSGLDIGGVNAEVMPAQWEYQIGPSPGIDCSDQLWLSRFMLHRVAEDFGVEVTFEPKPMLGDWNGTGCHCNFSTKSMRSPGGVKLIMDSMEKLKEAHLDHMDVYGTDNHLRMTGKHETAHFDEFSFKVASRGSSVRIPRVTEKKGAGHFEDRRPAGNVDPYDCTSMLVKTCLLDGDGKKKAN